MLDCTKITIKKSVGTVNVGFPAMNGGVLRARPLVVPGF